MPRPIYLIAASDGVRAALEAAGAAVTALDSGAALGDLAEREPGIVLVNGSGGDDLVELAQRLVDLDPGWTLALLERDGAVRSLGLGAPHAVAEVGEHAAGDPPTAGVLLELRGVLAEVARIRHDLNNPLTSALAEVQLLLLDAEDDEMREALEVTQTQLRRLRDMIADTRHLRLPIR